MPQKKVFLDTNAFRNLAIIIDKLPEELREKRLNLIKVQLLKHNLVLSTNFWVIVELLNHLEDRDDSAYKQCASALKILFQISSTKLSGGMVMMNPTFESYVQHGYIPDSQNPYKDTQNTVLEIAQEFVEKGETELFKNNINQVSDLLSTYKHKALNAINEEKQIFKDKLKEIGYNNFPLKSINHPDGAHGNPKLEREIELIKFIQREFIKVRVRNILGELSESLSHEDWIELEAKFGLASIRRTHIFNNGINGGNELGPNYANHFIDLALCDDIDFNDDSLLVTNDGFKSNGETKQGSVKDTFSLLDQEHRVISLKSFLNDELGLSEELNPL